jgi:RNA polymerase sigma-70 factor (ECF subfamily)
MSEGRHGAAQVYEQLGATLRGVLRRQVRDEHLADDLVQETFLRIHDKLGGLRDDERLRPWVFRVARNVVVDHFRKRSESPDGSVEHAPEETVEDTTNFNAEFGEWLARAVEQLPDTYREAVRLAELEGLRQQDVAERLGLTLSGAKSRVQRGRELLRGMLQACCHVELDRYGNVVDYRPRQACGCSVGADGPSAC